MELETGRTVEIMAVTGMADMVTTDHTAMVVIIVVNMVTTDNNTDHIVAMIIGEMIGDVIITKL